MVLESRHLMGLFLGVVVICGVFFALGYTAGRTQRDGSVRADGARKTPADTAVDPQKDPATSGVPAPNEWTFPAAADAKKPADTLQPIQKQAPALSPVANPKATAPASKAHSPSYSKSLRAPAIPKGAIVLQIAALSRESDALALADLLQQKEFPAFVLTPAGSSLHRVQVGPYADMPSADAAKRALQGEGFKAIVKR